jgi:hypothetical protein
VEPFPALISSNNIKKHSESQYAKSSLHLYIVRSSNNTQTTVSLNGSGHRSGRIFHRRTSTGKRLRGSGSQSSAGDGDGGNEGGNGRGRKRAKKNPTAERSDSHEEYGLPGKQAAPVQSENASGRRTSGRPWKPTIKATEATLTVARKKNPVMLRQGMEPNSQKLSSNRCAGRASSSRSKGEKGGNVTSSQL